MNLKTVRLFLFSSVLLLLMVGCGGDPIQPTPYPTYTPYPTFTSVPPTVTPNPTYTPFPTFTSVLPATPHSTFPSILPTQESLSGYDSCLLATGDANTLEDSNLEHVLVKVGASPLLNMWWLSPQERWFLNHANQAWITQLKMTWVI